MKFDFLKDRSGDRIGLKAFEEGVFDKKGRNLIDKIKSINTKILYIQDSIKAIDERIAKLKDTNIVINPFEEALEKVIVRKNPNSNICLLSDDNGYVTSEYGYDYKLLSGILFTGNYNKYIKNGDWIELKTADGATYKMYANIDTYYGEGPDGGKKIGHHIDFISDNLIYGSTSMENGAWIYEKTNINTWRMNYDTTFRDVGTNNAVATETSPFLANSIEHRGSEGGIIDKLNNYYTNNIPGGLKSYIIKKYHNVPTRYQADTALTDDNGSKWADMPYLWIPYYTEVWGKDVNDYPPTKTYEEGMKQYFTFSDIANFIIKQDMRDTTTAGRWWTASATSGEDFRFCTVTNVAGYDRAFNWYIGAPLCFRFDAKQYDINPMIREDLDANICLLRDNKGQVTSDYNYTYDFISDGLYQGDFDAYVRDGDWIELTANNGDVFKLYANVDTYYGEGPDGDKIGHHIDFISKDLIPGSCGDGNLSLIERNTFFYNKDTTYHSAYGSNQGVATEKSPFLSNSFTHRASTSGTMIDKLNDYYINNIPSELKSFIIKKYHNTPIRYQDGTGLTSDNGIEWKELPYLWLPYEKEAFGTNTCATPTYEAWMKYYYVFSNIPNFNFKSDAKLVTSGSDSKVGPWYLASAMDGSTTDFCRVTAGGGVPVLGRAAESYGVPLCFRFTARPASKDPIKRDTHAGNICLLSDNNGTITSGYNYDYEFLSDTLYSGNYSDYIKDGDYIELTTADGATYKMYANIDTYYGEGPDGDKIGHHIDFISKELIYGSTSRENGTPLYNETDKKSWRMNKDTTYSSYGNNNGVATETSPFLANSTKHRGSEGGIIDKLDAYYNDNLPTRLKSYIIKKYHNVPTRYQQGSGLTNDNGTKWAEMPYLWVPYYKEIWGDTTTSLPPTLEYESSMVRYHSFSEIPGFIYKRDNKDTSGGCWHWWTASAYSVTNISFCRVYKDGIPDATYGFYGDIGVPLCFRFTGRPASKDPIVRDRHAGNICLLKDDNGVVTSEYNYNYEFLSESLYNGNYSDFIKDGDYIELTTNDGATYKMYANVDTYYGEGPDGDKIGHHIDFISKELIYGSTSRENGSALYGESDIKTWRMNKDTTYSSYGSNNGVEAETSPFLANSSKYRGSEGGIIDKLDAYFIDNIPNTLKSYIIKKHHKVPTRYQQGTGLTNDNGSKWAELPYLWVPYYKEIWGDTTTSLPPTLEYESSMVRYHSFSEIPGFIYKKDARDTSDCWNWWTASAYSVTNISFCRVYKDGIPNATYAFYGDMGVPLCFRFTGRPASKDPIKRDAHAGNICLLSDNNGTITSGYNYDYEFIANTLESGNYSDYIKDGDYIELTTADGATYKMIANVDTYYGYGDGTNTIGHHIDFISNNLIYGSINWIMNSQSTYSTSGNNNGVAAETSPFLANTIKYRGSEGIIDKLDTFYTNNIPGTLKTYICKKYLNVPTRYQEGAGLTSDNGSKWADLPYLWIPYAREVFGDEYEGTFTDRFISSYESTMSQYYTLSATTGNRIKKDLSVGDESANQWWTASASSNPNNLNNYDYIKVDTNGAIGTGIANPDSPIRGVPICFRFTSPNSDGSPRVREDTTTNVCLMKDLGNGVCKSDYGYSYAFIAEKLDSGNYSDYIKDGDYLELTTLDGYTHKMYANIDTYYGEGPDGNKIGHHIDFISKDIIPNSVGWLYNTDYTTTAYGTGNNNGVLTEPSPFLSNTARHRSTGVIVDKLDEYFTTKFPESIKTYVTKKYHNVPNRYSSSGSLTSDNGSSWRNMTYLWLPYEKEIFGNTTLATATYESWMKQYNSFIKISDFKIKKREDGTAQYWWSASACNGYTHNIVGVRPNGNIVDIGENKTNGTVNAGIGAPLCFRFMGSPIDDTRLVRQDSTANICLLKDNNGTVTSDYNYDYEFISRVLSGGNYGDYIKDGDWIELTTADGYTHKLYANIDSYYGTGTEGKIISHHIDFISKDLIPNSVGWLYNSDTSVFWAGNNNGVSKCRSPFLSNGTKYRSTGVIVDKLNAYFKNIPNSLKPYINRKYHNIPLRYSDSGAIKSDNDSIWGYMTYLWLPYATEVYGRNAGATPTYESYMKMYPVFNSVENFRIKYDTKKNASSSSYWWTASAGDGEVHTIIGVQPNGYEVPVGGKNSAGNYSNGTNNSGLGAPLCFRFQ